MNRIKNTFFFLQPYYKKQAIGVFAQQAICYDGMTLIHAAGKVFPCVNGSKKDWILEFAIQIASNFYVWTALLTSTDTTQCNRPLSHALMAGIPVYLCNIRIKKGK